MGGNSYYGKKGVLKVRKTIYVIGGDLRQITVSELLKDEGFDVFTIGLSDSDFDLRCLSNADSVVLPIPVSYDNIYINAPISKKRIAISDLADNVNKNCFILGACISKETEDIFKSKGLEYCDYYKREELIIKNAIPTAEGAVEIALAEMPITLFESRVLIVGYGRIGKILADRLSAFGADVTVSARKCSDFAWIEAHGIKAVHTNELIKRVGDYDLILNTVPAVVFTEEVLRCVKDTSLVIDLASKPGGVDFNTAKKLGKNVIWALSLPGKSAPITSGKMIKETIMNIFAETEV